jgi:hypothetical protein
VYFLGFVDLLRFICFLCLLLLVGLLVPFAQLHLLSRGLLPRSKPCVFWCPPACRWGRVARSGCEQKKTAVPMIKLENEYLEAREPGGPHLLLRAGLHGFALALARALCSLVSLHFASSRTCHCFAVLSLSISHFLTFCPSFTHMHQITHTHLITHILFPRERVYTGSDHPAMGWEGVASV